jgi:hypothetical protein
MHFPEVTRQTSFSVPGSSPDNNVLAVLVRNEARIYDFRNFFLLGSDFFLPFSEVLLGFRLLFFGFRVKLGFHLAIELGAGFELFLFVE